MTLLDRIQNHPRNRLAAEHPAGEYLVPGRAVGAGTAQLRREPRVWQLCWACAVVLAIIAAVTLGKPYLEISGLVDASAHATRDINLRPLGGFERSSLWYAPLINVIGNALLFLPFGITAVAVGRTWAQAASASVRRLSFGVPGAIILGSVLSLGIEAAQYFFAVGYSDIDDVIFNTLGAGLGAMWFVRLGQGSRRLVLGAIAAAGTGVLVALGGAHVAGIIG